jgi:hypothetical protein
LNKVAHHKLSVSTNYLAHRAGIKSGPERNVILGCSGKAVAVVIRLSIGFLGNYPGHVNGTAWGSRNGNRAGETR